MRRLTVWKPTPIVDNCHPVGTRVPLDKVRIDKVSAEMPIKGGGRGI